MLADAAPVGKVLRFATAADVAGCLGACMVGLALMTTTGWSGQAAQETTFGQDLAFLLNAKV